MSVLFSVPYALCSTRIFSTRIFTVFCGTGTPACALLISCGPQAPSPANLYLLLFCGTGTPACALLISCGPQAPSPANLYLLLFCGTGTPACALKSLRHLRSLLF